MALQMNKRPELTKQYLVVFILTKICDQLFGCSLLPQNNAGEQVKYPFVTYRLIDPHRYTTADHRSDQIECTIQLDCHSNDQFVSTQMAEKLLEALTNSSGYRDYFTQCFIVPHEPQTNSDLQDRTTSIFGVNYDQTVGFDYAFTIGHANTIWQEKDLKFEFNEYLIDSIQATSKINGDSIDVDRNNKEED